VLELAGQVSELELVVQRMLSGARFNSALIVLFVGAISATIAVGRTIKPAAEETPVPAESKPAESKPAESKPAESKPAESKPAESKPAAKKAAPQKKAPAKRTAPAKKSTPAKKAPEKASAAE